MKGQMKRLFAVLLTVLLITDSQSAACSSLASFAMGARRVQASELSAESTADVSAVPGEIDGFALLGDMAYEDTSYFDAEGGAGEEFSADSSFGGEINDDASLFDAASADPESSGESALGAAQEDAEIFGDAAPADAEIFGDGAPDAEEFSVTGEAANGGLDEWNPDAGFETDPAQGSLDQEDAADADQAAVEENADSVFEDEGQEVWESGEETETPEGTFEEALPEDGSGQDQGLTAGEDAPEGSAVEAPADESAEDVTFEEDGQGEPGSEESFIEDGATEDGAAEDGAVEEDPFAETDPSAGNDSMENGAAEEGFNDAGAVPAEDQAATGDSGDAFADVPTGEGATESDGRNEAENLPGTDVAAVEEAGADSVLVTAVLGDSGTPISDTYTGLTIPVEGDILDLTASPIQEDVSRAVPVEGTQRLYVESFQYDYATIGSEKITSLAKKDIKEDTVVYLHYSNTQVKTKYVYDDTQIKVTAVVNDPEAIPDDAILSVNPITAEANKAAFDAYMDALNGNAGQIASQTTQGVVSEYNAANTLLYDIAFLAPKADENGNILPGEYVEIKPSGNAVSVSMQFKGKQLSKELKAENSEDIQVVHLPMNDALTGAVDTTQDIIAGGDQNLYTHEEMVDSIIPEVIDVQQADLTKKVEKVSFEAVDFSAYAITLAGSDSSISFNVKINFCDDEGNAVPSDKVSFDKKYYLVAHIPGQVYKGWGYVDCDYIYSQEIQPNDGSSYSMTINSAALSQFRAYYWNAFQGEYLSGPYSGKVVNISITDSSPGDYKNGIGNGQKIGDFTLEMTGSTSRTLDANGHTDDIVINAVKSGYKYEVQAFESDGVTPVSACGLSDSYYVIAHKAGNTDHYFVENLDTEGLNGGRQTGTIGTFYGKYYHGNKSSYTPGDNIVVDLVSSDNMYPDPEKYGIDQAVFYPAGSYLEGKFKVESVSVNDSNTKTTIKLVKVPEYDYKIVVRTLDGQETTGNASGLDLKVLSSSGHISQNSGYYFASAGNLGLNGSDQGKMSWFDDSVVQIVNSTASTLAEISQSEEKYSDGDTVADRYTMGVSVDDEQRMVTITLTELPKYYVKNAVVKLNEETVLDTGNYYIYTDMENADGTHSYYLQKWDSIAANGYQVGESSDADMQNPRPYAPDKNITVKLLKASGQLTLDEEGVIGSYRAITEGQLVDGFKVSYSEQKPEGSDHDMTVTLTEVKPGQDYPVDIKFIDHYDEPVSPGLPNDYYLLATLKPADGTDEIVAWALKKVTWDDSATTTVVLENGEFNICGSDHEPTGEMIGFNPEEFTISTRLYRSVDGAELHSYNEVVADGRDDVEGYDFISNKQELNDDQNPVKSVITLKKATTKKYTVTVEGTDKLAPSGKKYYVFLKAEHASTADTFALSDEIDLTGSFSDVIEDSSWVRADGSEGDAFTGNEKAIKYYIVETAADAAKPAPDAVAAVLNGGDSDVIRVYSQNALFGSTAAAKFVFDGREDVQDIHNTDITDKLVIKDSTATNDYDVKSIMGPGLLYGLTADYFNPNGHLQTNFAVNRLTPCDSTTFGWVHPNLAGNPGTIAAASIDNGTKLRIEADTSLTAIPIVVDSSDTGKVVTGMSESLDPPGYVVELDSTQITKQIVEPIIHHMKHMSEELLAHEDTFEPEIVEYEDEITALNQTYAITCAELDVTAYPYDATIYLDGERYQKYLAQKEALTIKKWPDQVIVFNFDTATNVDLDTFRVQYKNEDNTWQDSFSTQSDWEDVSGETINHKIDFAAQHIIFNCANAKTVQTGGACGMFFVPRDDSTLTIKYESGAGWIVSAGTVTSDNTLLYENGFDDNSCFEWHGIYSEMPDASNASLTLKKHINGREADNSKTFNFSIDRYDVGVKSPWFCGLAHC